MLKQAANKKVDFKEKVVQIYENLLSGAECDSSHFWDEFFLLKANCAALEARIVNLNDAEFAQSRTAIQTVSRQCVAYSTWNENANPVRVVNALLTLVSMCRALCARSGGSSFDFFDALFGFAHARTLVRRTFEQLSTILARPECNVSLKTVAFRVLLCLVTLIDNVHQNVLIEYCEASAAGRSAIAASTDSDSPVDETEWESVNGSLFDALFDILTDPQSRARFGARCFEVLTIVGAFRRNEPASTTFSTRLATLDNEAAFNACASLVSDALRAALRCAEPTEVESTSPNSATTAPANSNSTGLLHSVTSWFGSLLVGNDEEQRSSACALQTAQSVALFTTYLVLSRNRNFVTSLTHSHAPAFSLLSPTDPSAPAATGTTLQTQQSTDSIDPTGPVAESETDGDASAGGIGGAPPPSNAMCTLLEFASATMQKLVGGAPTDCSNVAYANTKLCFVLLACVVEDSYANSLLHDANFTFQLTLHAATLRHRRASQTKQAGSRPLACAVLDLVIEFLVSHTYPKSFPFDLYMLSLDIVHKLIAYQKRNLVRLAYDWTQLWTALIAVLRFVVRNENTLANKQQCNIFALFLKIVIVLNLFITYGDMFLQKPTMYDLLYYELIRVHSVFENVQSLSLRFANANTYVHRECAQKVSSLLSNIRAITNHFSPKIEQWTAKNSTAALSQDVVLELVRSNYDSLTLKLHDGLDTCERYFEEQRDEAFFAQLTRKLVIEVRTAQLAFLHEPRAIADTLKELTATNSAPNSPKPPV